MIANSQLITDIHVLEEEHKRMLEEIDDLVTKLKRLDLEYRKLNSHKNKLELLVQEQINKIAKLLYVIDLYQSRMSELDPEFKIPEQVLKFLK